MERKPNLCRAVISCVRLARVTTEQQGGEAVCELLRRLSAVPSVDNSTHHTESQVLRHVVEYAGKGIDDDDEEADEDDEDDDSEG